MKLKVDGVTVEPSIVVGLRGVVCTSVHGGLPSLRGWLVGRLVEARDLPWAR